MPPSQTTCLTPPSFIPYATDTPIPMISLPMRMLRKRKRKIRLRLSFTARKSTEMLLHTTSTWWNLRSVMSMVEVRVCPNYANGTQVIVFGVPPAARGVRRTNHSCSVKGCFNLLSPTTPWKMCDQCRAHERSVRKVRAMRESGIDVEPLPPRRLREKREPKDKTKQSANKKGKQKEIDPQPSESPSRSVSRDRTTESSSNEREGSVLVFMNPIVPEEQPPAVEVSRFIRSNKTTSLKQHSNAGLYTQHRLWRQMVPGMLQRQQKVRRRHS